MASFTTQFQSPLLKEIVPTEPMSYRHFAAQQLNNHASEMIVEGNYEQAISDLTSALALAKTDIHENQERPPCKCRYCCLESCLMPVGEPQENDDFETAKRLCFDNNTRHDVSTNDDDAMDTTDPYEETDDTTTDSLDCKQHSLVSSADTTEEGFVYCRPLRVHRQSINQGHYMGVTLSLIILFNISLANHLKAIAAFRNNNSHKNFKILAQALQLYELSYELHSNAIQQSDSELDHMVSLRFTMIITNNLSEIHRLAGNDEKQKMCVEHLMGAMMYMFHNCEMTVLTQEEMDGFYRTLSPIIGTHICAAAA